MRTKQRVLGSSRREANATRTIAAALGVFAGVSGLDHGLFETLQGNASTPGLIVQAIGPTQRMWVYGTEDAFTVVPNFLATGILAIAVGMLISAWSIGFIHRQNGPVVFLSSWHWAVPGGWGRRAGRVHRPRLGRLTADRPSLDKEAELPPCRRRPGTRAAMVGPPSRRPGVRRSRAGDRDHWVCARCD